MDIILRLEEEKGCGAVENLAREAFWNGYIVLLQSRSLSCSPGVLGDKPWPPGADTATAQGIGGARSGPGTGRNPRKARFFAEQKMRPKNYALQGKAL
jgi:hypothetical protein